MEKKKTSGHKNNQVLLFIANKREEYIYIYVLPCNIISFKFFF